MLGTRSSLSEVMTLNTELLQHCMWRVVIVWEKEEVLESWPMINFVKFQAFDIISFCVCNKNVILKMHVYMEFERILFWHVSFWWNFELPKMRPKWGCHSLTVTKKYSTVFVFICWQSFWSFLHEIKSRKLELS